jgi:glycosyltransferase involved in cell wall biosynthesis
MALETPIVASAIAPVHEVLGDDTRALLAPVDDARALANAIVSAFDDETRADRAAAARSHFLGRFTVERVAEEMVRFYERALSG